MTMTICELIKDNEFLREQLDVLMTLTETFTKLSNEQQRFIDNFMQEHEIVDDALNRMTKENKDFNVRRIFNVHCNNMGVSDIVNERVEIYKRCEELDGIARSIYKDNYDKLNNLV